MFPYNFEFTIKLLEKLRNYEILDSKSITGSKRYYFTGKTIDSTHYNKPKNRLKINPENHICKSCGSSNTLKNGADKGTQRYKCKDCGLSFQEEYKRFYNNKIKREAIILHDDGNSLREIAGLLNKTYKLDISYGTIKNWIDDFNNGRTSLDDNKKIEKMEKMEEKPKKTCKYCGGTVRYNHIACSDCRELWVKDIFETEIKPILTENKECNMSELFHKSSLKSNQTLWRLVKEMISNGWVSCHTKGRLKICSLPGTEIKEKIPQNMPNSKPVKVHPKIEKEWKEAKENRKGLKTVSSQNEKIEDVKMTDTNQRLRGVIIEDMQTSNNEGNSIKTHLQLLNKLGEIEAKGGVINKKTV